MVLSANDDLHGLGVAISRRDPDLSIAEIRDPALYGDSWRVTGIDFFRFTTGPAYGPNSLFESRGIAGRIRILPGGVLFAATRVQHEIAVIRDAHFTEFLAVIGIVRGELPGGELRTFGHPDVALPLLIQRPGDTVCIFCRGEIRRARGAENLVEREGVR